MSSFNSTLHKIIICKYVFMDGLHHLIIVCHGLLSFAVVGTSFTYFANIWYPSPTLIRIISNFSQSFFGERFYSQHDGLSLQWHWTNQHLFSDQLLYQKWSPFLKAYIFKVWKQHNLNKCAPPRCNAWKEECKVIACPNLLMWMTNKDFQPTWPVFSSSLASDSHYM